MILSYQGITPKLHESVFVAEGAQIIGDVKIGRYSSVWFNAVVRGDVNFIEIGERTNVQDNSVIHVTHKKHPTFVASNVTIGHSAIIHGCHIEDYSLIGMGAILLDGCRIGERSLVAAGALVREGFVVPPKSLVAGVPARVVRDLKIDEIEKIEESAQNYVDYVANYRTHT
ncbi:MAG TPA: gamma carbonic anhydrase family protein [Candidatus Acidoferrales bacterium]|nr:gamma carbonic anhydrase family protein [Candidatus Acidoferrales bacterium]